MYVSIYWLHIEKWLIVNCQQADAHNTTTTNKKLAVDFLEKSFNGCFANYSIGDSDKDWEPLQFNIRVRLFFTNYFIKQRNNSLLLLLRS